MFKRLHFNYGVTPALLLGELLLLAIAVLTLDFEGHVAEVSFIELVQAGVILLVLALCLWAYRFARIPLAARQCFLVFASLVLFAFSREMSYGRILYYDESFPLTHDMYLFYKHKIPCLLLRGITYSFFGGAILYFIGMRVFMRIAELLKTMKIYVWDIILILATAATSSVAESVYYNSNVDEIGELLLYLFIFNACWRYARNDDQAWGLFDA